jgi:Protein of unknown function (DUF3237)
MKHRSLLNSLLLAAAFVVSNPATLRAAPPPNAEGSSISHGPMAILNADVTGLTVYGPTPVGVRVDVAFKGQLHGRLQGTMEGIDYSTIRADGVTELHVLAKITTPDQALISVEIKGIMIEGKVRDTEVKFLTAAPQYAWLMDKIIIGKGFATTEKISVKYFLLD